MTERRKSIAPRVSRVLAKAGMTRGSANRKVGGFVVMGIKYGEDAGGAHVTFTRLGASVECDQAQEILSSAGFEVLESPGNGLAGDYWLTVKPR